MLKLLLPSEDNGLTVDKNSLRSTGITFILTALEGMKMVQEAWFCKKKKWRRSVSLSQNQEVLLPNERDGISVLSFYSPQMCKRVNGDAPDLFRHNANACTKCIATNKIVVARHLTHPTAGELSLENATHDARKF